MYRLRSDVEISPVSGLKVAIGFSGKFTQDMVLADCDDPRIPALGRRQLILDSKTQDVLASLNIDSPDEATYTKLRILHGLSDGPEIVNRIPLECNLDLLNYIDFNKGCYVGQELIARTKFKVKKKN
jgi:folate-binding protein YgfZ